MNFRVAEQEDESQDQKHLIEPGDFFLWINSDNERVLARRGLGAGLTDEVCLFAVPYISTANFNFGALGPSSVRAIKNVQITYELVKE